jgi:hypothetical protein
MTNLCNNCGEACGRQLLCEECRSTCKQCDRLREEVGKLEANESDYLKMIAAVLRCNPIPACYRDDDILEPPWDVVDRVREERDRLREEVERLQALQGKLVITERYMVEEPRQAQEGNSNGK